MRAQLLYFKVPSELIQKQERKKEPSRTLAKLIPSCSLFSHPSWKVFLPPFCLSKSWVASEIHDYSSTPTPALTPSKSAVC